MSEQFHDYDPASALDSAEAIEVFMADALEYSDEVYVAKAEAVAKRAMQRLATRASLRLRCTDVGLVEDGD